MQPLTSKWSFRPKIEREMETYTSYIRTSTCIDRRWFHESSTLSSLIPIRLTALCFIASFIQSFVYSLLHNFTRKESFSNAASFVRSLCIHHSVISFVYFSFNSLINECAYRSGRKIVEWKTGELCRSCVEISFKQHQILIVLLCRLIYAVFKFSNTMNQLDWWHFSTYLSWMKKNVEKPKIQIHIHNKYTNARTHARTNEPNLFDKNRSSFKYYTLYIGRGKQYC